MLGGGLAPNSPLVKPMLKSKSFLILNCIKYKGVHEYRTQCSHDRLLSQNTNVLQYFIFIFLHLFRN
jgi:hypothetical protein